MRWYFYAALWGVIAVCAGLAIRFFADDDFPWAMGMSIVSGVAASFTVLCHVLDHAEQHARIHDDGDLP